MTSIHLLNFINDCIFFNENFNQNFDLFPELIEEDFSTELDDFALLELIEDTSAPAIDLVNTLSQTETTVISKPLITRSLAESLAESTAMFALLNIDNIFDDLTDDDIEFMMSITSADDHIRYPNSFSVATIFDAPQTSVLSVNDNPNIDDIFKMEDIDIYSKSILTFVNQLEDVSTYDNLENVTSIYHYSIPNIKLSYPEPFIASPSFMHSDLWFVHILVYQYWLWFIFIFIIVFFFITFLCTVRWCNMRVRPRRETRGVSRSKCGDLITATVPVTWAVSIIVSESTDAIDYYDGFGTTELVVGIRAYQWGWEYYYPKDIDLNYNIKPSYSTFVGNSLRYNKGSDTTLRANNLWKFYQNKTSDQVITPAHLLVIPLDNHKFLNFLNFNDIGSNSIQEVNAFKKIKMFSKAYTTNLVTPTNSFSNKYKNFSKLYINDNMFLDSYLYGMKRQHNFLSSNAILNNQSTFLNLKSANKLINFNFNNKLKLNSSLNNNTNSYFFEKTKTFNNEINFLNFEKITDKFIKKDNSNSLKNFLNYSNLVSSLNDNSDKKKINQPIYKLFNDKLTNSNNLNNLNNLNLINSETDNTVISKNNEIGNFFFNNSVSYKNVSTASSNQSPSPSERFIRNGVSLSPSTSQYNYSLNLNSLEEYLNKSSSSIGLTNSNFFNFSNSGWISPITSSKYFSAKPFFDYSYSPILSNNPYLDNLNYDSLHSNADNQITPNIFQGKDELISNNVMNVYWNFYWNNSTVEWKIFNNVQYQPIHQSFYLPMFSFYYDYDFRNWQSLELLEDAYWESIYSIYTHDEYLALAKDFYEQEYFDKFSNLYNKFNRNKSNKDKILTKPFFKNTLINGESYPTPLYLDDNINPTNLINTKDFSTFSLFSSLSNMEDSYESLKYLNYFFLNNNKTFLTSLNNGFQPYSYSLVFDMFRSNYDDFSWYFDENNFNKTIYSPVTNVFYNNVDDYYYDMMDFYIYNVDSDVNLIKSNRFSNNINLRLPVKNSMINYNAIQKVFRTRFDEGRSNTKLSDISSSFSDQPLISSSRVSYEKLLGKNKESFFKINFYKNNFQNYFNNLYDSTSSLNFYFYDFPFLLALKSDASRYLWFDWFSKWGLYEVQPSSSSRYAIYGMPYFSKPFDFITTGNETFNESETYFLRLSRSRRNYMPNWIYTPYFYARNVSWYKNNLLYDIINQNSNPLTATQNLLNSMNWYWNDIYFLNFNNSLFHPSSSGITTYSKSNWKPQSSVQSYYYNVSTLIDILTKREYLYREFLANNNKIVNLPFYLTNNPSNPLINEVKSSFLFFDPINLNNEYSRDIYFNSLSFFNFNVIKSLLTTYSEFINLSLINDYLFFYFFNKNYVNSLQNNSELYKNQFRPMKKGITNMIRLQATGAIALPIEIRIQILASSKDVIHSWSIPSAGIKIDCVPGYSSHRVIIFLVSGIFWGQCMEICGRYHHWMPIVVYFMKRDLFFLWCTHFVFLTGSNNVWNINDRQYVDYVKTVSFDKYSWLSELNK